MSFGNEVMCRASQPNEWQKDGFVGRGPVLLVIACLALTIPLQSCKRKAIPRSAEETSEASEAGQ